MVVIGLYSAAPGSGKTTGANYLAARLDGAQVLSLAGPLKEVVKTLLRQAGLSEERIRLHSDEGKELPIPELSGLSMRKLCQLMGTEFGRKLIDKDLWINLWHKQVLAAQSGGVKHIIVDDVRFENEAKAVKFCGGIVIAVVRSKALATAKDEVLMHASEGGLEDWAFDAVVGNEGTVPEFCTKLREAVVHHG